MRFMASTKAVELGSTNLFRTPPHPALGMASEPRDIGIPGLDPRLEPGAHDNPTSMGEPGGRPSNSQSSRLVRGEAMPLARPPMPESPDPPEVGKWMGGMAAVSSPYAGCIHGPGVGDTLLDCKGSYTSSEPNSSLIMASHPAVPISFGVTYGQGTLGLGVLR